MEWLIADSTVDEYNRRDRLKDLFFDKLGQDEGIACHWELEGTGEYYEWQWESIRHASRYELFTKRINMTYILLWTFQRRTQLGINRELRYGLKRQEVRVKYALPRT